MNQNMESHDYEEVKTHDPDESVIEIVKYRWPPFLRQMFVVSGVSSIYFVLGLGFGVPTVMIPHIRKEANSTYVMDEDMASWLSSVHGYSSLPWVFIIAICTRYFGRKLPFLIICLNTLICFIVFYYSVNTTQLLISAIMLGMLLASNMTLFVLIITEYSSPRYRAVFMILKATFFYWGVWVANILGVFSHWKHIGVLALVCSLYSLTALFWPESPYWLAMKGRFEECAVSHRWLRGSDNDTEYELKTLINSQKAYLETCAERKCDVSRNQLKYIMEMCLTKAYYMPVFISISVMSMYHFSGKLVCSMYAIDLMNQFTGSEQTAVIGMLIMDSVTLIGMQLGCVLSKYLKRRTLFFSTAITGIAFLFVISIYLYLIKYAIIIENKNISILLLTLFSVSISTGPMIMPSTIFGELLCSRYQTSSLLILTLYSEFLMASILKISPYMFKSFTLPGAFLFYGTSSSIFCFIIYKYLPETKDKTLHEIQSFFKEPVKPKA
ncbi:facilitated trehalose transporter Tret1 [Manduca sexta]|uniref:facilitated trehalose transporter Tret1 n=1 Tax=Manduca sexta TaxID=7130 RepID=UPI00188E4D79|nr:facilitated trehalose transporter Tret1 [Manduca sexta]